MALEAATPSLARVGEVLHSLVAARKSMLLYPATNSRVTESIRRLDDLVKALFAGGAETHALEDPPPDEGEVKEAPAATLPGLDEGVNVEVTRDGFFMGGQIVAGQYPGANKFARDLYRQGVKLLWLIPGADQEELRAFLEASCEGVQNHASAATYAKNLANGSFEHIGVEQIEGLRLVASDGLNRPRDILDYLRERRIQRGDSPGDEQELIDYSDAEDVSDLAAFFLEMSQGSQENESYLFNTLSNPERLAKTLTHVASLRHFGPELPGTMPMNVLRQTLNHIADHLRSLPDRMRVLIARNVAEAIHITDEPTQDRVVTEALAPALGREAMGAEVAKGFNDEHVAALVSSHVALHEGTANTVSNFLHDFSADPRRRETIRRLAARNLSELDDDSLQEVIEFLERSEDVVAPEKPSGPSSGRIEIGTEMEQHRAAMATELHLTGDESAALEEALESAMGRSNEDYALLMAFALYAGGSIDELSEELRKGVQDGLFMAIREKRHGFPARVWGLWAAETGAERRTKMHQILWPSVEMFAKPSNLSSVFRHLHALNDDGAFEDTIQLLGFVPRNAVPLLFQQITTETDRDFRQLLLRIFLRFGDKTVPYLSRRIEHEEWFVTRNVAYLIGELGLEAGIDALAQVMAHRDMRVRREVLAALAAIGGERAEDLLIESLNDDEVIIRTMSAEWLGKLGVERALPGITATLMDTEGGLSKRPRLAPGVIHAVGQLGGPGDDGVIREFMRVTEGRRPADVTAACEMAIGNIEGRASTPGENTE